MYLEFLMVAAAVGAIAKIADADGRSMLLWGAITFILVLLSFQIPLPYLRVLLAAVVAFIGMMVAKAREGP